MFTDADRAFLRELLIVPDIGAEPSDAEKEIATDPHTQPKTLKVGRAFAQLLKQISASYDSVRGARGQVSRTGWGSYGEENDDRGHQSGPTQSSNQPFAGE